MDMADEGAVGIKTTAAHLQQNKGRGGAQPYESEVAVTPSEKISQS
jgi:hypothetical protein